uniref:Protein kinase domain-containing protein n=1 Tax=Salix viminalis TaxID=40686 RepID=A0A6N2NDK8_SALVM
MASDTQIDYGFYNLSVGEFPDRVNAIALCRGDVAVDSLYDTILKQIYIRVVDEKPSSHLETKVLELKHICTVQCTPDLSEEQCSSCLLDVFRLSNCCNGNVKGKIGAKLNYPSCNLRWEVVNFFNGTLEILPPPPQVLSPTSLPAPSQAVDEIESAESLQFAFNTIRDATEEFSEKNMLGQGGFGAVYKGVLPSGQEIAVKRLSKNSGQGDLEFKNEVLLVAKLQHRNLVRLLGFCLQGIERLLIYEFVPNASLDHFIFDPTKRVQLNWERRYKIIGGIARGLLYLHEDSRLRIIHRDLKASNILLDEEMNPKISDFGMARLFVVDQTQGNTSRIVGTYGYMAPEYAMEGHFSVKSDVFSFGVLVLEIVTGKKNSFRNGDDIEHLMSHAWKNWREGTAQNIIDPVLSNAQQQK